MTRISSRSSPIQLNFSTGLLQKVATNAVCVYDLVLIAGFTLVPKKGPSGAPNFAGLTGGVYKT